MTSEQIKAVEMQARWLAWINNPASVRQIYGEVYGTEKAEADEHSVYKALPIYKLILEQADTFFMNEQFCDLVDHARKDLPDDLAFESSWMQSQVGFLWLQEPFLLPQIGSKELRDFEIKSKKRMKVAAIGWVKIKAQLEGQSEPRDGYHIVTFFDFSYYKHSSPGFGCWSYFTLIDGMQVAHRINNFENTRQGESYYGELEPFVRQEAHEIRWVYAALHLMSQKMAHHSRIQTSKGIRKIGIQNNRPVSEFLRVISLRRLEEEREKSKLTGNRVFNWQWAVRGHWRNQPYADGTFKQIFIESYIKGPKGKPLKPVGHKLFLARR